MITHAHSSCSAFRSIFPALPLYAGGKNHLRELTGLYANPMLLCAVLITAVDVLFVLAFFQRPDRGRKGMMAFEGLIVSLVCTSLLFLREHTRANKLTDSF